MDKSPLLRNLVIAIRLHYSRNNGYLKEIMSLTKLVSDGYYFYVQGAHTVGGGYAEFRFNT